MNTVKVKSTKANEPHAFIPCNYDEFHAVGIGMCSNPYGWDTCHLKGCERSREHPIHALDAGVPQAQPAAEPVTLDVSARSEG